LGLFLEYLGDSLELLSFKEKLEIIKVYKSEVMKNPLPRSLSAISALGTLRGSAIGKNYAEAFMLLKQIIV